MALTLNKIEKICIEAKNASYKLSNSSNFDRVRLSYPQTGSSLKPFIYASSLANGYNLSSLINDAPIAF